jgi:uncharacterized BrkB/YihY/UPF0761 family membrane protein
MSRPSALDRVDRWQRRHALIGFPFAVVKRYSEDHGGWLGAIVTYYGFFAMAPLLGVVMTIADALFADEPSRRQRLLGAISDVLPVRRAGHAAEPGADRRVTGILSCLTNTAIALGLFRLLVARHLSLREMLPGALGVGVGSYALTLAGGRYVQYVVAGASSLYGSFATMVGLFAWIALLVQTVVYGTLVNLVRVEIVWPRSLTGHDLDASDHRAAALTATRAVLVAAAGHRPDLPRRRGVAGRASWRDVRAASHRAVVVRCAIAPRGAAGVARLEGGQP